MPLGFARSVLTHQAAVAGVSGYAFNDGQAVNAANKASYNVNVNSTLSNTTDISAVFWIRINGTGQIDSPGTRLMRFIDSNDSGGGSINLFSDRVEMNWYDPTRNNLAINTSTSSNTNYNTTNFATNVLDGAWHCVMIGMGGTNTANRYIYIDGNDCGVDKQTFINNLTATGTDADDIRNFNIGYQASSGTTTTYTAAWERGAQFDIGPIWWYGSFVDFSNSTTRGYYYNAGNTDGYVDGGTDGTGGGATQPVLYLYHTASTLANGGTNSTTPSLVTQSSGAITILDTTGPGSGDAY